MGNWTRRFFSIAGRLPGLIGVAGTWLLRWFLYGMGELYVDITTALCAFVLTHPTCCYRIPIPIFLTDPTTLCCNAPADGARQDRSPPDPQSHQISQSNTSTLTTSSSSPNRIQNSCPPCAHHPLSAATYHYDVIRYDYPMHRHACSHRLEFTILGSFEMLLLLGSVPAAGNGLAVVA